MKGKVAVLLVLDSTGGVETSLPTEISSWCFMMVLESVV